MTRREVISRAVTDIQPEYIQQAADYRVKKVHWAKWAALAACLCLLAGAILRQGGEGVTVTYGDPLFPLGVHKGDLVFLTEEEMFAEEPMYIFQGKVVNLENVTLNFGGSLEYRCVATVAVEKVYRGEAASGTEIRMLLPCPILREGLWVEDTEVISRLRVGMEGIFMPRVYTDTSRMEMNGKTLLLAELAECGLDDGQRWAFLDTEDGLVFARDAYPGAAGAKTLEEIGVYVETMVKASVSG